MLFSIFFCYTIAYARTLMLVLVLMSMLMSHPLLLFLSFLLKNDITFSSLGNLADNSFLSYSL